jgi:hypothetical protein
VSAKSAKTVAEPVIVTWHTAHGGVRSATGGVLLGTMLGILEGVLGDGADVAHAAAVLRVLGLTRADAARVAARVMHDSAQG